MEQEEKVEEGEEGKEGESERGGGCLEPKVLLAVKLERGWHQGEVHWRNGHHVTAWALRHLLPPACKAGRGGDRLSHNGRIRVLQARDCEDAQGREEGREKKRSKHGDEPKAEGHR